MRIENPRAPYNPLAELVMNSDPVYIYEAFGIGRTNLARPLEKEWTNIVSGTVATDNSSTENTVYTAREATGEIDDVMRVYELRDKGSTYRDIAEDVPWSLPTIGKLLNRREQYKAVADGARLGYELTIVEPKPA